MSKNRKPIYNLLIACIIAMSALAFLIPPLSQQPVAKAASALALNPIQKENLLPGTTNWEISHPAPLDSSNYTHDKSIEGYASTTSVAVKGTISFAVNTVSTTFTADTYRLGWYQGTGGRLMSSLTNLAGHSYTVPAPNPQTGLVEAHWPWAFSITIPTSWISGMYLVKLTDLNGEQSYIPFAVRSSVKSNYVFIYTANTDEAYNAWGGTSLYQDMTSTLPAGRAFQVSFDRPYAENFGAQNLLSWEYPMIRWLEKDGYNVSYVSEVDVQTNPKILLGHHGILIVGHSEYWSQQMRKNLQAAVNMGVNLAVFGANSIYWQIRYQSSSSSVPNRVITCYKSAALDPQSNKKKNAQVTVQFRQPPVNSPEQTLLGSMYNSYFAQGEGNYGFPWVVSDASSWVFAGTNLQNGDSIPGIVGYEFDSNFPDAAQPATITGADQVSGVEVLSSSPVTDVYGNTSNANSTLYTAPSGARVFNAGTIEWSWGLDPWTLYTIPPNAVNPAIQRITANILFNFLT
ncbi:MAG: N,N-dimethylformamidase beta subunit family domain-containing protein [Ktedonobacteraceae bacterium]